MKSSFILQFLSDVPTPSPEDLIFVTKFICPRFQDTTS